MSEQQHKKGDLRIWWIPQIPMQAFTVDVETPEQGDKVLTVLAAYDLFQYENRVKGDYSNAGGLQTWDDDADGDGNPGWVDYEEGYWD